LPIGSDKERNQGRDQEGRELKSWIVGGKLEKAKLKRKRGKTNSGKRERASIA